MTVVTLLFVVIGVIVVGSLAYWVITKFLPPPSHMIALAIVGCLLLLVIFALFFPGISGQKVW